MIEVAPRPVAHRLHATEERFRLAQAAGGIGWFEWDLTIDDWEWTPPVAVLFGFDPASRGRRLRTGSRPSSSTMCPKLRRRRRGRRPTGRYYVEFRVIHSRRQRPLDRRQGRSSTATRRAARRWIAGVYYEISERKALEARLLALNESLEARVADRGRQLAATAPN